MTNMADFVSNEHMAHMFHEIVAQMFLDHGVALPDDEMMEIISTGCSKQYNQNMERFLAYAHEKDEVSAEAMLEGLKDGDKRLLLVMGMVSEIISMLTAYQAAFLVMKDRVPMEEE